MDCSELFNLAKKVEVKDLIITINSCCNTTISIKNKNIDKYEIGENETYTFKGKYKENFGVFTCETYEENDNQKIIDAIIACAKCIDNKISEELHADLVKVDNVKSAPNYDIKNKIKEMKSLYEEAYDYCPFIKDLKASFSTDYKKIKILNSLGLEKADSNFSYYNFLKIIIEKNGQCEFAVFEYEGIEDVDLKTKFKEVIDEALSKLNKATAESSKYKVILANSVASDIFETLFSFFYLDNVQKEKSIFKNKLNCHIASKNLTIIENPTDINACNKRLFDDEGVNTRGKAIIENGVLKTFLSNLKTAALANEETTGNGYKESTGIINAFIKPGDKTKEELISTIKDGIYIAKVTGLHAGINKVSGSISLQANGFLVKNGKLEGFLESFIFNSDFSKLINNIEEIGENIIISKRALRSPALIIAEADITF